MLSRISANFTSAMSSYSQMISKKTFSAAPSGRMLVLNDMGNLPDAQKKVDEKINSYVYLFHVSVAFVHSVTNFAHCYIPSYQYREGDGAEA